MARIGFLCPPITGHLNPIGTLARALGKRGHTTLAFQIPEARRAIEAQGLEFYPFGEGQTDTEAIAHAVDRLGALTGLEAARFTVDCATAMATAMCRFAPEVIRKASVELLVVDQNEPAGATLAQHLDIPFINVASLPLNREPKVPPPFVSWRYDNRITTTLLNLAAYAVFDRLVAPVNRVLNTYRRSWNLPPIRRPDDTFSNIAQLCQLTADFDFPRIRKHPALHYLGPFRDHGRPHVPFPYERLNGKPLVYASLGTVLNRRSQVFQSIIEGCANLDAQLVLSTGGRSIENTLRLSSGPIVVTYAPQLELLERAAVCVTHGGLNTVMEALGCGVPLVAIPFTNDQPAVAARVRRAGAGEVIPLRRLTADRLQAAVSRVLSVRSYHQRAQVLRRSIAEAGGVERAADLTEEVLVSSGRASVRSHAGSLRPHSSEHIAGAILEETDFAPPSGGRIERRH